MSQAPVLNHTCLRIKDPKISLEFYKKHFGFTHRKTIQVNDDATLYVIGLNGDPNAFGDRNWSGQEGLLELKHDHGSESDPNFKVNNGNEGEFRGFGHICISVDNIGFVESKLLSDGVQFKKKLSDGRQKDIAFALDPDGYWIELIENGINKADGKTDPVSYRLNHTMVRIKDPKVSVDFYKNVLGFKLLQTREFPEADFTLYFLGFVADPNFKENSLSNKEMAARSGVLELTHNYGTESDPEFKGYHNGNTTENGATVGYGHICVSTTDPAATVAKIDAALGPNTWLKKWGVSEPEEIGFFRDPDGYEIELFDHNTLQGAQDDQLKL